MSNDSTHDFLAAAAVPTNEQRIVSSLENINATLMSIEHRLFSYINSLPKPYVQGATQAPQNAMIPKGPKGK